MKNQEKSKYSKYLRIEIIYGVGIIIITGALYFMAIMLDIGSQEIFKKKHRKNLNFITKNWKFF